MNMLALLLALAIAPGARLDAAAKVADAAHASIAPDEWNRARCVLVIPRGEDGKGVMSCRAGSRWSAPVFMQLAKRSAQTDLVVLVMNEDGVQKLLQNAVTLGADAEGLRPYARTQGRFIGTDLAGGVLRADEDGNRDVYGAGANPRSILANSDISAPTEAQPFLNALGSRKLEAVEPPASPPAAKAEPAPRSQAAEDVRARIVSLEQTIDRLLAQPAAAGTITVERAQLTQIRQQLDALLAAVR